MEWLMWDMDNVGKTTITHPPNHKFIDDINMYKPFPVMGGL